MEIIDQIRQVANIVEIASQYTTIRQRGRKHIGLCPFHAEKSPSFTVDSEKGLFHCFGCGIGGDVFSLVMEKENLSFPEALKYLAEKYRIPLPERRKLSPQALRLEEQLQEISESALAFFKKNLFNTQEGASALEYLEKRSIPEKIIRDFKLGYAPKSWDALVNYFRGKGVAAGLLEKAGLAVPGKKAGQFYDRFRGRAIFPIFSLTGKAVAFGGRTLFNEEPKYLNSPDTPLYSKGHLLYGLNFTKESVRTAGEVVLVEGYTDFLSLYTAGITNCAASLGTSLTPGQVGLALRFAASVVINYDGDSAGKLATSRAIPLLFDSGIDVSIVTLPDGFDPDTFIRKNGPEEYKKWLSRRVPLIRFLIEHFTPKDPKNTPEERIRVAKAVLQATLINPNTLKGSEYLRQMCEYLDLREDLVRDSLNIKFREDSPEAPVTFSPAERRLLQILVEKKDLHPDIFAEVREDDFRGLQSEPIFTIILSWFRKDKEFILHDLQKEIGPSLSGPLSRALQERENSPTLAEALDCLCALRISSKENELRKIQAEIARLGKTGERDRIRSLLVQKQELTKQILALK